MVPTEWTDDARDEWEDATEDRDPEEWTRTSGGVAMSEKVIALDFDNVLHNYTGWNNGKLNTPIEGAVEAWYKLYEAGYTLVIFTCRDDLENVRAWMHRHFDFERHIGHFYEPVITNKKPLAIAYIDDRAIRFTNWDDICRYFC